MSSSEPGPRPRQVTIGGWVIAVSSAVLVVTVFDSMAQLHSLDTRDRLTKALTGWPTDMGIGIGDALSVVRGALFVTAVAAVVTGILGFFVLQRHATARIVLTVAAVPLVLTAPVAGGVLGLLIGGATVMLWTQEARDWFAGRAPARPARERPAPSARPWAAPASLREPPDRAGADRAGWPPPAYAVPIVRAHTTPPKEVRLACALTWVLSALTAILYVAFVITVAVARDDVLARLNDNAAVRNAELSDSQLIGLVVAVSAFAVAWSIVAALLAALTWRRQAVPRRLLLVSSAASSVISLAALPYSLVHVVAGTVTFVLLLKPAARAWVGQDRRRAQPPPSDKAPLW